MTGAARPAPKDKQSRVKTHKSQKSLSPAVFPFLGFWNGSEKYESDQQVTFYESGP
jgi:hypothetical protein